MSDYKELIERLNDPRWVMNIGAVRACEISADALARLTAERDELNKLCEFNERTMADLLTQRDAALAVIEQMRVVVKQVADHLYDGTGGDDFDIAELAESALALKPDLTALRKRDAETLRKAADAVAESLTAVAARIELLRMADRIENGEVL